MVGSLFQDTSVQLHLSQLNCSFWAKIQSVHQCQPAELDRRTYRPIQEKIICNQTHAAVGQDISKVINIDYEQ